MIQSNTLRVFGKLWKLRAFNGSVGDDDAAGITRHAELRIDIDACQPREHVQDTLLHEIIHAVDEELHNGMSEAQVSQLATGLFAVMRDNPAVRRFIFGGN